MWWEVVKTDILHFMKHSVMIPNVHEKFLHNGLREIRLKYWIVKGRCFVRFIVACSWRLAVSATTTSPTFKFWVKEKPPSGVDFARPLCVKTNDIMKIGYACTHAVSPEWYTWTLSLTCPPKTLRGSLHAENCHANLMARHSRQHQRWLKLTEKFSATFLELV